MPTKKTKDRTEHEHHEHGHDHGHDCHCHEHEHEHHEPGKRASVATFLGMIYRLLLRWYEHNNHQHGEEVKKMDELNAAIADLATAVNALAVAYAADPTQAQLAAALTSIKAVTKTATDALTPPTP